MKIGIVGNGKMGTDMFQYFQEKDVRLVLITYLQEEAESLHAKNIKQLKRMLKREFITEDEFDKRMSSFIIDTDYRILNGCDFVVETVIENLLIKQRVVKQIEENVEDNCIIASNSSSLDLDQIFVKCEKKERCMGLHFFFPIKYINYVEVNKALCTNDNLAKRLEGIMIGLDKKVLMLEKEANYWLSKIITTLVSYSYLLYQEGNLSIEAVDKLMKEKFMMFGPFEMVDSTGLTIINECTKSFMNERQYNMIKTIGDAIEEALLQGYCGGVSDKGFVDYEKERCNEKAIPTEEITVLEEYVNRIKSILCNEAAYFLNKYSNDNVLEAMEEVLGLRESISTIYQTIGNTSVLKYLNQDYKKYTMKCMVAEDFKSL